MCDSLRVEQPDSRVGSVLYQQRPHWWQRFQVSVGQTSIQFSDFLIGLSGYKSIQTTLVWISTDWRQHWKVWNMYNFSSMHDAFKWGWQGSSSVVFISIREHSDIYFTLEFYLAGSTRSKKKCFRGIDLGLCKWRRRSVDKHLKMKQEDNF